MVGALLSKRQIVVHQGAGSARPSGAFPHENELAFGCGLSDHVDPLLHLLHAQCVHLKHAAVQVGELDALKPLVEGDRVLHKGVQVVAKPLQELDRLHLPHFLDLDVVKAGGLFAVWHLFFQLSELLENYDEELAVIGL